MGIAASYGVVSALGVMFTPMHNVLPFLLLGIGIDDMFVIVQCWDSQQEEWHREAAALEEDGKGKCSPYLVFRLRDSTM